ncbi:MAG: ParB/RepB/Spo0J family partition protein [Proteobacteria bacterium]|nr:ParB/RepB/Spo0J family partition protein [Pseudomonadota bacterium]
MTSIKRDCDLFNGHLLFENRTGTLTSILGGGLYLFGKGILEPLIVTGQEDGAYLLICGERRLVAAQQLGLESVPVRVIEEGKESGETIALQLTENLQREDLNPIDQAKGIISFIQAKHPDLFHTISLLKLSPEIQAAISAENLPFLRGISLPQTLIARIS